MKDKKRFFIRLATVLVLIGIAVLMYFLGRGHTVYFDNRKLEYDGVTYDILYDILIKQNGDIHSDWTGVKLDVDAYRKVVFEPYDLRVLEGTIDF